MKKLLFLVVLIIAVVFAGMRYFRPTPSSPATASADGSQIKFKDSVISIAYTDDNSGEDLIIHSDKETYAGFSQSDIYFSVANPQDADQAVDLQFLFPEDGGTVTAVQEVDPLLAPQYSSNDEKTAPWKKMSMATTEIPMTADLQAAAAKKKTIPEGFVSDGRIKFAMAPKQTLYFKARIAYTPGQKGEFWIEGFGNKGSYGLLDPWYSSSWLYRRAITIGKNMVGGGADLTNFPTLVKVSAQDLCTTGSGGRVNGAAGEDILFTDSDGTTLLDYELEKYTCSGVGNVTAWVEVPTLSYTVNTIIYMYYGGTAVSNADPTGLWDDNGYEAVWHLNDASSPAQDSTSNNNDAATASASVTYGTASQINEGVTIPNGNGHLEATDNASLDQDQLQTVSCWMYSTSLGAVADYVMTKVLPSRATSWWLRVATSVGSSLRPSYNISVSALDAGAGGNGVGDSTVSPLSWHYLVGTYDGNGGTNDLKMQIYLDGRREVLTFPSSNVPANIPPTNQNVWLGDLNFTDRAWNGPLDECRIASATRTSGWVLTEYQNQSTPLTYVILGPVEIQNQAGAGVKVRGGTEVRGGVKIH